MITFQWLHWITTKDDDDDDPMKKELSFKFGSCSVTISNLKIFFFFLVYHYYCCCCCRQLVFTMIKDQILLVIAIKLTTDQIRIVSFFIFFGYSISIWKLIKFTHYTHTFGGGLFVWFSPICLRTTTTTTKRLSISFRFKIQTKKKFFDWKLNEKKTWITKKNNDKQNGKKINKLPYGLSVWTSISRCPSYFCCFCCCCCLGYF